jgi:short-subunit dehydrogenase
MQLKGKTVYITGGTGGIGTPLVKMMREAGATVNVYDMAISGDLVQNIDKTCAYLRENTPDILINMAGYNELDYCENQNLKAIIDLNMMVPMYLTQAVLPTMKGRNSGQIINIGSMTAIIPLPHLTGYVAAKAGLKGFNDSLRRELGETDIKLTYIIPRAVQTPMNSGAKAIVNEKTNVTYDDPENVAARIFNAIINQEKEVRFGWPERFFAFVNANFPFVIDQGLQKTRKIGEDALNQNLNTKENENEKYTNENSIKQRVAS